MAQDTFAARARVVVAWVAMQRLDFAVTDTELAQARIFLDRQHDSFVQVIDHLIRGYLLVHDGEIVKTRAHLESFPSTVEPLPAFVEAHLTTLRSWCALAAGDLDGIDEEIPQLEALDLDSQADIARAVALDIRGRTTDALMLLRPDRPRPTTRWQPTRLRRSRPRRTSPGSWPATASAADAQAQVRDLLTTMTPHQRLFVSGVATKPQIVELLTDEATSEQLHAGSGRRAGGAARRTQASCRARPGRTKCRARAGPIALGPPHARLLEPVIDLRDRPTGSGSTRAANRPRSTPSLVVDLTAREHDVLHELALGGSYADIAQVLYITENTVKTHLASLYRKLGRDPSRRRAASGPAGRPARRLNPG